MMNLAPHSMSHHGEERELRSAIAFAKGVDGVEFSKKMRSCRRKCRRILTAKTICLSQPGEQPAHLPVNVLGIAKHATALADAHSAQPACPRVNIPEDMPVYGAVVAVAQASDGKRLVKALGHHRSFEGVKSRLLSQVCAVL